ncbi:MAG: hypothetical protein ACK56W_25650 [Pirellula sp.]
MPRKELSSLFKTHETMLTPMLSDAALQESARGSIDPLGIYPIADILASRLVPVVRER